MLPESRRLSAMRCGKARLRIANMRVTWFGSSKRGCALINSRRFALEQSRDDQLVREVAALVSNHRRLKVFFKTRVDTERRRISLIEGLCTAYISAGPAFLQPTEGRR